MGLDELRKLYPEAIRPSTLVELIYNKIALGLNENCCTRIRSVLVDGLADIELRLSLNGGSGVYSSETIELRQLASVCWACREHFSVAFLKNKNIEERKR